MQMSDANMTTAGFQKWWCPRR